MNNVTRNLKIVWLAVCAATLLAGCGSLDSVDSRGATTTGHVVPEPPSPRPCCVNPRGPDPLDDPQSLLSRRSFYFDYDNNRLKAESLPIIEAHGRYLLDNKSRAIAIEGHTDQRGAREYNLALGFSRAEAVRQVMLTLGVPDTQIETISYGEEKPQASGSDEAAWQQNRRVDIVYR